MKRFKFCLLLVLNALIANSAGTYKLIIMSPPPTNMAMAVPTNMKYYCESNGICIGRFNANEYLEVEFPVGVPQKVRVYSNYDGFVYCEDAASKKYMWRPMNLNGKNAEGSIVYFDVATGIARMKSNERAFAAALSNGMTKSLWNNSNKSNKEEQTTSVVKQNIPQQSNSSTTQTSEFGVVYIAYSSDKIEYPQLRFFYEVDGTYVASTGEQEYFKIELPVGVHSINVYMNPVNVKNKGTGLDAKTQYYSSYEEVKKKSKYFPVSKKIKIVAGDNYYRYTGDMVVLSKDEFNEHLSHGLLTRESPVLVPAMVPKSDRPNNQIELTSKNKSHKALTSPSVVDVNIPTISSANENTYVLIIANEQYDLLDNVSYATNDGKIFKEYCEKTLGVPTRQVFYYENASYGRIADGVEKLKYCLDNFEGSKGIVYYCGHGIPEEKSKQAYIIPVDGKGTNMATCYSLNKLYKTLAGTKAQSVTYFLDACFTGANKEGGMLVAARGVAVKPVGEPLSGKTIVFSASSEDETAMTLSEQGHGLFTYYLLKKLQETKGNVTYGELADYIKANVKKDAFLINEKPQTPVVATSPAVVNTWKSMKLK